jgi:2-dehydropantoate 2-reductase
MKVVVLGAGQMGSIHGAAFLEQGNDVYFFDTYQPLVDAINADGLAIDRRDGRTDQYRVRATSDPSSLGIVADLVLCMVKGYATRDAAEQARPLTDQHTILLTLQNGLGNDEVLRSCYPTNEHLVGVTLHTVITVGLAHYRHTGVRETYIGPGKGGSIESARRIAAALEGPAFPVVAMSATDIARERWGKFIINCVTLPVSALTRLDIDVLREQSPVVDLMDDLARETCAIARAQGIDLDPRERIGFIHDVLARAGGRASMLGDVFAHRKLENETINGAAVAYADRLGVAAPLNRAMYALLAGLDRAIEVGVQ